MFSITKKAPVSNSYAQGTDIYHLASGCFGLSFAVSDSVIYKNAGQTILRDSHGSLRYLSDPFRDCHSENTLLFTVTQCKNTASSFHGIPALSDNGKILKNF